MTRHKIHDGHSEHVAGDMHQTPRGRKLKTEMVLDPTEGCKNGRVRSTECIGIVNIPSVVAWYICLRSFGEQRLLE